MFGTASGIHNGQASFRDIVFDVRWMKAEIALASAQYRELRRNTIKARRHDFEVQPSPSFGLLTVEVQFIYVSSMRDWFCDLGSEFKALDPDLETIVCKSHQ
jgi:hypothetical protein